MAIPASQLETWSRQGSVTQSASTYQSIRNTLQQTDAPYAQGNYSIFLQGSYGNDTNIYADSDVDVVMQLNSVYYADTTKLPEIDAAEYARNFSPAVFSWSEFRSEVTTGLVATYGGAVEPGRKAIRIAAGGGRRHTDVLPAAEFRRYFAYSSAANQRFAAGICFWLPDGTRIVNYPKQHAENLTAKHQRTASWFKPTVRVFKNMRNAMFDAGFIADGAAPSYYVEAMLHNVPDAVFGGSFGDSVVAALNWLWTCDRSALTCANGQYMLLHPTSPMTWRAETFEAFLNAAVRFWNLRH